MIKKYVAVFMALHLSVTAAFAQSAELTTQQIESLLNKPAQVYKGVNPQEAGAVTALSAVAIGTFIRQQRITAAALKQLTQQPFPAMIETVKKMMSIVEKDAVLRANNPMLRIRVNRAFEALLERRGHSYYHITPHTGPANTIPSSVKYDFMYDLDKVKFKGSQNTKQFKQLIKEANVITGRKPAVSVNWKAMAIRTAVISVAALVLIRTDDAKMMSPTTPISKRNLVYTQTLAEAYENLPDYFANTVLDLYYEGNPRTVVQIIKEHPHYYALLKEQVEAVTSPRTAAEIKDILSPTPSVYKADILGEVQNNRPNMYEGFKPGFNLRP